MSPRPRSDRRYVGVRLMQTGYDVIERMAEDENVTVSDMIRTLLSEAVQARQAAHSASLASRCPAALAGPPRSPGA